MKNKIILSIMGICILGLIIFSFLKITECNSSLGDCDIECNEGQKEVSEATMNSLPDGYTLDTYTIEKVTGETCKQNSDCETPMDYLVQSRCPFTSLCLENKCTVVCPDVKTIEFQGEITQIQTEMDGSILTVEDGDDVYEVLVSIPNLGEEYVSHIKNIEVGKYIQVIGNPLKIMDSERIIASQIYVEGTFTGEHPCNLEPDAGSCEAAMPRYYFDKEEGKCKQFLWGGCDGVVPFDLLEVCKSTCERSIPEKPALTKELCENDGGRVVNTINDDCDEDEINIGEIEGEIDCNCICCMITGGRSTNEK